MPYKFNPLTGKLDYYKKSEDSIVVDTINASSSKTVDTITLSNFKIAEYTITLYNNAQGVLVSFNLSVNNNNGVLRDSLYNRIGKGINYKIDADVNGLDYELVVENNESYDLTIEYKQSNF